MADITTTLNNDDVIFEAENNKGLEWLGQQQVSVPSAEAAAFKRSAKDEGLVVKSTGF